MAFQSEVSLEARLLIMCYAYYFNLHAWFAVELEENSNKVLENEYPFLNPKYSPDHLFIDTNDGNGQVYTMSVIV